MNLLRRFTSAPRQVRNRNRGLSLFSFLFSFLKQAMEGGQLLPAIPHPKTKRHQATPLLQLDRHAPACYRPDNQKAMEFA